MSDALEFGHEVPATHLVVCCIDHRCTDDLVAVIPGIINDPDKKDWDRYDLIALPGASLGPMQDEHRSWGKAFWSQFGIALSLHKDIRTVVVADHLHCGAYKQLYLGYESNREAAHEHITLRFAAEVKARHPWLKVERWLLQPMKEQDGAKVPYLNWEAKSLDTGIVVPPCRKHPCT